MMNDKKKTSLLPANNSVLVDVIVLAIISASCFFLPFARYSYSNKVYNFAGYLFLTGAKIMRGSVRIAPVPMLYFPMLINFLTICLAIAYKKMSGKAGGLLIEKSTLFRIVC